ncbi:MAG TPA: STAS domain-containing protein [Frankiaceae bacterium]|nr:STAS domain-containing protein [Frankiaceae bacterium]
MHDVVVRGTCDSGFLDAFRKRQVPWQLSIDLSGMTFCDPLGLVALAAFAEAAARAGERLVVRRPADPAVANYVARMRLGNVLGSLGAEHDLPWVHEHEVGDALLELTSFDGARGAGALARHVHGVVEPLDLAAANALHDGICEAGQNVAHHSQRDRGFVAAQRYSGGRLQFAVGDSGVGDAGDARVARRGEPRRCAQTFVDSGRDGYG